MTSRYIMIRLVVFIIILLSSAISNERENIIKLLENYNNAFGKSDYSEIINCFDYPTSFNLIDKTIIASNKLKLKFIYKKIRGDLPDYYSYSKWEKIDIQLIDDKIAIVNANFSRYNNDDTIFYSGAAQYHLRFKNGEWKIFSLTPYTDSEILD